MNIEDIKLVANKDGFHNIDLQFADFIIKKTSAQSTYLYLAAALASNALRNSHLCAGLNELSEKTFPVYKSGLELDHEPEDLPSIKLPPLNIWVDELRKYPAIISDGSRTPLVLDSDNRLYLHRYWEYECRLAALIKKRCHTVLERTDYLQTESIKNISKYFKTTTEKIDWQQVAVFTALVNDFTLITGGPGTGKTTVVSSILAMQLDHNPNLKITVCAPTGKAASRLKESIRDEIANLSLSSDETVTKLENLESYTIHRLLGVKYLSPYFKHDSKNQIDTDIVIIDEASMVSQSLMTKLLEAIPLKARIIMLGDKDQLSSVEEGAVLADLCDAASTNQFSKEFCNKFHEKTAGRFQKLQPADKNFILADCVVELQKSQRFDDSKGIGLLKKAIADVEETGIDALWRTALKKSDELSLEQLPLKEILRITLRKYIDGVFIKHNNDKIKYDSYLRMETKEKAYEIFTEFKILCSHRNGIYGVENINKIVHELLIGSKKLEKGMPIMITENNNQQELYNGDIGMIWNDDNNILKAYFPKIGSAKLREIPIPFLPAYEEVFAMTIHKSQGSGFQDVLMILPDKDTPLLTRELIYTGLTRAKKYCKIWTDNEVFKQAILKKTVRNSGLRNKLIS
jgi:exodeoxyribonuclease V alpha subunit